MILLILTGVRENHIDLSPGSEPDIPTVSMYDPRQKVVGSPRPPAGPSGVRENEKDRSPQISENAISEGAPGPYDFETHDIP